MNPLKVSIKFFLLMTLLTGVIYPLFITIFAQLTFPEKANGSLIKQSGKIVGSSLIAQNSNDESFFWPRPSAVNYDPLHSGGSNLGPISKKLKGLVEERRQKQGENAPAELLYASGSGLDPHISIDAAYFQIDRISKARSINAEELKKIIDAHIEGKQFGFLGPSYVNVLQLNLYLEKNYARRR